MTPWSGLASLRFGVDVPPWLVVVVAMSLGLAVMALYLRESATMPRPWNWVLPGLRGTAVALMLFLIAAPIWHSRQIIGTPARVVFAVDRSASMTETDSLSIGSGSPDRVTRMRRLLIGDPSNASPGWLSRLAETHWAEVLAFDETAQVVWSRDQTQAFPLDAVPGASTNLMAPLAIAAGDTGAASTLVLMTDGRDTMRAGDADSGDAPSLTDAASELARRGWTVHTVGVGRADEPADLAVLDVIYPQRIAGEGRLAGSVKLKHFGYDGRRATLSITAADKVVWTKEITIDGDGVDQEPFDFPIADAMDPAVMPASRGVDRDSVVVPLTANIKLDDAGNSLSFRVAAASRERNVLVLDGSARWETRYLRNLLSRDPAWQVDTILFGPGTDRLNVIRGSQPGELPITARDWARYDAVILGEVPADRWTSQDAEGLRAFVNRGGGLIVIDGRYNQVAQLASPTRAIEIRPNADNPESISAAIESANQIADLIPVRYVDASGARKRVTSLRPTVAGAPHPVMLIESGRDGDPVASWKRLPPPASTPLIRAAAGAEVWAESVVDDDTRVPWLVTRMFGAGRVFYLATDETWRWRYKMESLLHGRFWNQLLTAAMQPPYAVRNDFVAIGTDQIDHPQGDAVTIRARLTRPEIGESDPAVDGPADLATVDALLIRDDTVVASVPMTVDDASRGTYIGRVSDLPVGAYWVRIRASGYDTAALQASTPIWIVDRRGGERDRVALDEPTLQAIAVAGGGRYVDEASAGELLETILPMSRGQILESDTPLYPSAWMFAIILTILAIEWSLRKKVGLA